jgi:hypothetical protein
MGGLGIANGRKQYSEEELRAEVARRLQLSLPALEKAVGKMRQLGVEPTPETIGMFLIMTEATGMQVTVVEEAQAMIQAKRRLMETSQAGIEGTRKRVEAERNSILARLRQVEEQGEKEIRGLEMTIEESGRRVFELESLLALLPMEAAEPEALV